jgi:xanthine dehydrogenase accessory factor
MKDFKAIIREYDKVDLTQRNAALATVVSVRGSSYRSPGARMLITDDGRWAGSISGGCLEGDALRKARQVMADRHPMTVTYDTREESNQYLGVGLGCHGIIDVLIEPLIADDDNNFVRLASEIVHTKCPLAMGTVFSGTRIGDRMLVNAEGQIQFFSGGVSWRESLRQELTGQFKTNRSEPKQFRIDDAPADVFLELIQPAISLLIFGGGFDARPVCQLAKSMGWNVTITDECVAHIAPSFFPDADALSLCHREFIDRDFEITPYTACILMSHNYDYDRDVLRKIMSSPAPYIGILGPRKRFDKMMEAFVSSGFDPEPEKIDRIHSPIGLDIGAEAPDEIAVSIIAEIQSKFARRSGGFLKDLGGPIHQRDGENVFRQVYLEEPPLKKN